MTQLLNSPIVPDGGTELRVLFGRTVFTAPAGLLEFVVDVEAFDFHVDVAPDCPPGVVATCLHSLAVLGLVPMEEDECPAEPLDNGMTRVYLVPLYPVDDQPLIPAHGPSVAA